MKNYIWALFLIFLGVLISCNKSNQEQTNDENEYLTSDTINQNIENEQLSEDNYYDNRTNYTYGFAVFKVHNDLNQRLNDIGGNRRPYPVQYNIVSKISTFTGPATEEAKFRVLDDEQSNLNRNLQVLEREFLIFNSYEEASRMRANY